MQNVAWTIGVGHFGWTVEAVEAEFDRMGRSGIVAPHPLHEFAIRVELAEAGAKSSLLHCFIRCRAATGHILIYSVRLWEAALDSDGAVAMRLDQVLNELVAQEKNVFAAMKCFSQSEQFHLV